MAGLLLFFVFYNFVNPTGRFAGQYLKNLKAKAREQLCFRVTKTAWRVSPLAVAAVAAAGPVVRKHLHLRVMPVFPILAFNKG